MTAIVNLRLLQKLNKLIPHDEKPIRQFEGYVAILAENAFFDVLRRRYPARMRLKNRLRYIITHDPRFALWTDTSATLCGLADWRGDPDGSEEFPITPGNATPAMLDQSDPARAVYEVFRLSREPMRLERLVQLLVELWNWSEAPEEPSLTTVTNDCKSPLADYESRELLLALWKEVEMLRPMQRRALLLNLRDHDGRDALRLLVLMRLVTIDQIALVLEMAPRELAALWSELPLDDNRIANTLGISRQQVINLRKSARERLNRRLKCPTKGLFA
ncbi:MAG TPA: hypothetical protein VNN08_13460 [Thermoanaerobaculia bacterium]|nr:hypothetical protein [Thermoanaerobaculia bacterium]